MGVMDWIKGGGRKAEVSKAHPDKALYKTTGSLIFIMAETL